MRPAWIWGSHEGRVLLTFIILSGPVGHNLCWENWWNIELRWSSIHPCIAIGSNVLLISMEGHLPLLRHWLGLLYFADPHITPPPAVFLKYGQLYLSGPAKCISHCCAYFCVLWKATFPSCGIDWAYFASSSSSSSSFAYFADPGPTPPILADTPPPPRAPAV